MIRTNIDFFSGFQFKFYRSKKPKKEENFPTIKKSFQSDKDKFQLLIRSTFSILNSRWRKIKIYGIIGK